MQVGNLDLDFLMSFGFVIVDDWGGTVFRMAILSDKLIN